MRRFHRAGLVDVVTADILPAEVIRENQDDIWLGGTAVRCCRQGRTGNEQPEEGTPNEWTSHEESLCEGVMNWHEKRSEGAFGRGKSG